MIDDRCLLMPRVGSKIRMVPPCIMLVALHAAFLSFPRRESEDDLWDDVGGGGGAGGGGDGNDAGGGLHGVEGVQRHARHEEMKRSQRCCSR